MRWLTNMTGAALAASLTLAGCGETAVDETFEGPLVAHYAFQVSQSGQTSVTDDTLALREGVRVALFWQVGGFRGSPEQVIEEPTSTFVPTTRNNVLTLRVAPPDEALVDGAWAMARVAGYIDADGDGRKGDDELFYGELRRRVLILALRDLDAATSPTGRPLAAGFHAQRVPIVCEKATLPPPTSDDCGVDFEAVCEGGEGDCGPGVCNGTRGNDPEAHSYCSVPAEDPFVGPDTCHPANAAFFPVWDGDAAVMSGFYTTACAVDADCPEAPSARCQPMGGYCEAARPDRLVLPGRQGLIPACVEEDGPKAYDLSRPGPSGAPPRRQ